MVRPLATLLCLGLLALGPVASAAEPQPAAVPQAIGEPADVAARAAALEGSLTELEGQAQAEGLTPAVLARPVGEGRRAIERARGAAASGDGRHAPMLFRLVDEWLETGRALLGAVRSERASRDVAGRASALQQKLERTRDVLTQHQAHKLSLLAEIARAEQTARARSGAAADAERARLDKAAGKKGAPQPKGPTPGAPQPAPKQPGPKGANGGHAP
ncbi:MAG: hypothetical protein HY908_10895 [Myxococcales bacterium]|nr:hypothetical protein [Myxococcales bacterium]